MGVATNYDNILNTCNLKTHERWTQQCYQNGSDEADVTGQCCIEDLRTFMWKQRLCNQSLGQEPV